MQIDTRTLNIDDYDELVSAMRRAYPKMSEYVWSKKSIAKLTKISNRDRFVLL